MYLIKSGQFNSLAEKLKYKNKMNERADLSDMPALESDCEDGETAIITLASHDTKELVSGKMTLLDAQSGADMTGKSQKSVYESVQNIRSLGEAWCAFQEQLASAQPWSNFTDSNRFSRPTSVRHVKERFQQNVVLMQSNYFLLFLAASAISMCRSFDLFLFTIGMLVWYFYALYTNPNPWVLTPTVSIGQQGKKIIIGTISLLGSWYLTPSLYSCLVITGFAALGVLLHALFWTNSSERPFDNDRVSQN